jgi:hypothetical protein
MVHNLSRWKREAGKDYLLPLPPRDPPPEEDPPPE